MFIVKAQDQNQTLNKPENVNVTSSDTGVYERINVTSDNQTQQQNLLPLMQSSQQTAPPMIPPPSTPRYAIPPLPFGESNYQPVVILSQSLYFNSMGDPLDQLGQLLGFQQPSSIGEHAYCRRGLQSSLSDCQLCQDYSNFLQCKWSSYRNRLRVCRSFRSSTRPEGPV